MPTATTEGFNAGPMAIGTGPFRMVSHRNGDRIEFERNDGYLGTGRHWQRVNYRMITNDAARTAALLAGDVEIIDQVPTSDLAKLRADQRLALSEITGLRLIFLGFDHARTEATPFVTDNDGKPLAGNPLKDLRVRRALSIAIDRNAIVERVMEGAAIPAGQFLPEGAFGYVPDLRADALRRRGREAAAGRGRLSRRASASPCTGRTTATRTTAASSRRSARCGPASACAPRSRRMPWTTFVGRAGGRNSRLPARLGHLLGRGVQPAAQPDRHLRPRQGLRRRPTAAATPTRRWTGCWTRRCASWTTRKREALLQQATRLAFDDVGDHSAAHPEERLGDAPRPDAMTPAPTS